MATQPKHPGAVGAESLLPVFASLFQGMAANAVKGDPEQYRQFRAKMHKVGDLDGVPASAPELNMKAETALNILQHHCSRTNEYFLGQATELRGAIDLLVGTLVDLAVATPESTRQLREIAGKINTAGDVTALRQGRLDLERRLSEIRQEAERRIETNADSAGKDAITDLGGRVAAEAALVEASASPSPVCAVVLLLDRLQLYNQRYGREVGDKTLRFFAELLQRTFSSESTLFRWAGPALLMLRNGPVDKVQPEVRRVLESRIQYDCETGSRHLLLSIDASWWVLPMMVDARLMINKIDSLTGN